MSRKFPPLISFWSHSSGVHCTYFASACKSLKNLPVLSADDPCRTVPAISILIFINYRRSKGKCATCARNPTSSKLLHPNNPLIHSIHEAMLGSNYCTEKRSSLFPPSCFISTHRAEMLKRFYVYILCHGLL